MSAQNDKHAPLTSVKTNKTMTKYFEQKEASELPEKSGEYLTNKGLLFFTKAGTAENINSYWMCAGDIEWWLLPVEIKGMTLEECKDKVAQKRGYQLWLQIIMEDIDIDVLCDEAAELYLSSNTAALREENERKDSLIETAVKTAFLKDDEIKNLELKVNTLTEALESIQNSPIPANEREVESWVFTCRQIVGTTLQSLTK